MNTEVEGHQGFVSSSRRHATRRVPRRRVDFDVSDKVFLGIGLRRTFGHEPTLYGFEGDGDFVQVLARVGASL
ncbi:MAG: hypothetical protein H6828_02010 [Planctomycetes bacterium]|nr:hypothetical protein [Planctomycetota bacterium]